MIPAKYKTKPLCYENSRKYPLCLRQCLRGSNPLSASTTLGATAIKYFLGMQKQENEIHQLFPVSHNTMPTYIKFFDMLHQAITLPDLLTYSRKWSRFLRQYAISDFFQLRNQHCKLCIYAADPSGLEVCCSRRYLILVITPRQLVVLFFDKKSRSNNYAKPVECKSRDTLTFYCMVPLIIRISIPQQLRAASFESCFIGFRQGCGCSGLASCQVGVVFLQNAAHLSPVQPGQVIIVVADPAVGEQRPQSTSILVLESLSSVIYPQLLYPSAFALRKSSIDVDSFFEYISTNSQSYIRIIMSQLLSTNSL